ncbi:target of Nesh-SH3 isoform X6 [Latimeria chalumnae]|uniref:target of Nesh-SH3 isoform X6 n=1 Tax=Latimeria chalumnae TaxID=7897 RepID=UPI00313F379E
MIPRLVFLFLCGLVLVEVGNAQRFIRVKRQSLKVQINATDDTIILKFVRPSPSTKLEGYILGYGSSLFSKQYIPLPEAGKSYETEVDAEPKYLIAVQPVPTGIFLRKQCTGQLNLPNPLHLVIGTVTPTAVFLTWSISIKPQKEVIITNDCVDDRFYTVRYREKEKNKKWLFKPCPTTETVIDKLKPDTMYEFGVKADKDNGIWSKPISHKTAEPFKDKGNGRIQNTYKPQLPDKMRMLPAKDIKIVLPARPIKPMNTTKHRIILPYRKPELPSKAKAHNQTKQWKPSKPVKSALPDHKLALNKTLLVTAKPTVPHKAEWPNTKPAPNEPQTGASKPITSDRAKLPMAKQAPNEPQIGTPKPITSDSADLPMTKQAPNEPQIGTPKPITSDSADLPMAKKAPIEPQIGTPKPITSQSTDLPMAKQAPIEPQIGTPKPITSQSTDLPMAKQAPIEPQIGTPKPITSQSTDLPMAKQAPIEPQIGTPKPITSQSTDLPMAKQAPIEPQIGTPKPITSQSTDLPMAKQAPIEPQIGTPKPITSQSTDLPMAKQAPIEPQIGTPKPITSQSTDLPMAKQAPIEPQIGTPKPITSDSTDLPMAKQASNDFQLGTPKPSLLDSTELPDTKLAQNETQIPTSKALTSDMVKMPNTNLAYDQTQIGISKPKIADKAEKPQITLANNRTQLGTSKPKIPDRPEWPNIKLAYNETQRGPPRPIPPNKVEWPKTKLVTIESHHGHYNPQTSNAIEWPGVTLAPNGTLQEDYALEWPVVPLKNGDNRASVSNTVPPLGSSRNTFKKEILRKDQIKAPERSPSAPVKPTVIQRKPWLLINKVDGKPGSKVIIPEPRAPRVTSTTAPVTVSVTTKAPRQKTYPAATVSQEATDTPPDNSSVFNSNPVSDIDPMGKQRYTAPSRTTSSTSPFEGTSSDHRLRSPSGPHDDDEEEETPTLQYDVPRASTTQVSAASCIPVRQAETAPHVLYMKKKPDIPCSITDSLSHFPTDEANNQNITSPPQYPPSNLTVVTVEGCPSFVILDWEKVENDTATEYEVISKEKGSPTGEDESILTTNQTHSAVENLKPDTSYEFIVKPKNTLGEGPSSNSMSFATESEDPRVTKKSSGKDAIWTAFPFQADEYSQCKGQQFVKRTWYRKFVGVQLCNSLRYKIYLSDSLTGKFYNIGDQTGYGEDHCQFVDSFLDGRTGQQLLPEQLPVKEGFYRAVRQEPVHFGEIGGQSQITYVHWYECGTTIPGRW